MNRNPLLAAAGATALAVSLAACGGPAKTSAPPPTTTPPTTAAPTTTTAPGSVASGLAGRADVLCAQIDKALSDSHHVKLTAPTSLARITGDFSRLQSDASSVAAAGRPGAHRNQIAGVVSAVRQALASGESAATALAKADVGTANRDFATLERDLSTARHRAETTNLRGCAAGSAAGG
jgi:hypothetical protein